MPDKDLNTSNSIQIGKYLCKIKNSNDPNNILSIDNDTFYTTYEAEGDGNSSLTGNITNTAEIQAQVMFISCHT